MGRHIGLQFRAASDEEKSIIEMGGGGGRGYKYPFASMEVGEAIVADGEQKFPIRCAIQGLKRAKGLRFKTRTLADGSLLIKRIE